MNGSTSDLKRCRTYALSEESFFLLETVQIVFGSPAKLSFSVSAADCFTNNISKNMN